MTWVRARSARRRLLTTAPFVLVLLAVAMFLPSGARAATPPRVVVSLTLDDGFATVWNIRPILERFHMHATFYINNGKLGEPGRLTASQVQQLAAAGNEIAGHSVDHLNLASLDAAEAQRQICNDRIALAGILGTAPTDFAYPYGATSPSVQGLVAGCGYNSARTVGGITSQDCAKTCPAAESIPPLHPYKIRTGLSVIPATSPTAPETQVLNALHHGGGWVTFVFHNYCDGCSGIAVNPSTFTTLLAWLQSMHSQGVVVETVHQVVGGPTRPLVAGPPPRLTATLVNPTLAIPGNPVAAKNGEASFCWEQAGYGTNVASYQRVPNAHAGQWAEQITMTNYTSGDAKLLVRQDIGTCSLAVQPGQTFRLSAWYTSTAPTRLVVFYRSKPDGWTYNASSSFVGPSSDWRQLTWTTPPVPAGVDRMSLGVSVSSIGTVTVDDFGIAPGPTAAAIAAANTSTSNRLRWWIEIVALLVLLAGVIMYSRRRSRAAS